MQLRALALFALGLAIGWIAGPMFRDRAAVDDSSEASRPPKTNADLKEELAWIRASVEELRRNSELAPAPILREPESCLTAGRQPLGEEAPTNEELLAAIQSLEAALVSRERDGVEDSTPLRPEDLLERMKDPTRGIDWAAWQPILNLWHQDRNAARKEVKLLTDEQVLERFGPPTDVWSNAQGITWQYARDWDPITKKFGTDVILRIPDGYVTQLAVR